MDALWHTVQDVEDLLASGGDVLWVLFGVAFLLWWLILDRLWYFYGPHHYQKDLHLQKELETYSPEEALWLRRQWLSEARQLSNRGLMAIKGLIQICPLLGLLGTITGMIEVFESLSITGSNSARALSSGIAHATLPTMSGLVIALSGYYFVTLFEHRARKENLTLREHLMLPEHLQHRL